MQDIFITQAKRTAIGSFLGSLSKIPSHVLSSYVIKELTKDIDPKIIGEIILGHVLQGGCGQNTARQAAVKAGIPYDIPSMTINKVCGSGLKAVELGWQSILAGKNDVVLAGGHENMSLAMHATYLRNGLKYGHNEQVDLIVRDGLSDAFSGKIMGLTAENIAKKYNISRFEQDEFSYNSQLKAANAKKQGLFDKEILPVEFEIDKQLALFFKDEFIKENSNLEKLSKLKPAFDQNGTITAGNASGINDGAAGILLASEQAIKTHKLQPLAKIVSFASSGVDPEFMGTGPISATQKALKKAGWKVENLDLIEVNEAFAATTICVIRELGLDPSKVNVNGGAIALGHPIGASGARILVSLIHEMERRKAKKGLATLCIGGGMGMALCIEK